MSEDYTGGWDSLATAATTAATTSTYGGSWLLQWPPHVSPAPQPMPSGWKCTDCSTVMAPWMASHKCPAGTVTTNLGDASVTQVLYKNDTGTEAP